jgi:hypothetical protein
VAFWDQLNTRTIKDVASTDIQRQSDAIHLEEENRQALMDVALVNKSQLRDGNPMPDQGKVVQTTGDSDRIQFQPDAGQVWQFVGGDILEQATGTFSVNFQLIDSDTGNIALLFQSSTTGQEVIGRDTAYYAVPIIVTNTLYLNADVTAGTGRISTAFVRIR